MNYFNNKNIKEDLHYNTDNKTLVIDRSNQIVFSWNIFKSKAWRFIKVYFNTYLKYYTMYNVMIVHPNQIVNTNLNCKKTLTSK